MPRILPAILIVLAALGCGPRDPGPCYEHATGLVEADRVHCYHPDHRLEIAGEFAVCRCKVKPVECEIPLAKSPETGF